MQKIKSWMLPPEPIPEGDILKSYDADVVILGAGYAGTCAARAAAEAGASVILVEAQQEKAFNVYGSQYGSINSKTAQSQGVPYYDPVVIMRDWQHRSLNRANPELIRKFAWHNGEVFDWFIEPMSDKAKRGIRFMMNPKPSGFEDELNGFYNFVGTACFEDPDRPMGFGPPPGERKEPDGPGSPGGPDGEPAGGGMPPMPSPRDNPCSIGGAVLANHERIRALGGQIFYGINGRQLIQENGRVTGLLGYNYKKEYFRFRAKNGVILAAGDFSGNKDMVADLLTELVDLCQDGDREPIIGGGRTGMGIRMGIWAGGIMEPAPRGGMWCCVAGNGGPMDGSAFLKLNAKGERYTNEGIFGYWGAGLQGARQPNGPLVTIWDSDWRKALEYQTLDHSAVDIHAPGTAEHIEQQLAQARKLGVDDSYRVSGPPSAYRGKFNRLVCADTLEALADKLGYEGAAKARFLASVARYNTLCDLGRDEDFAKDSRQLFPIRKAPFYAFQERYHATGNLMVAVSGLMVDGEQRVLDKDYEPIPGLYASGNCSGGRFPIMYTTPVAGVSIGIACCLGNIVGTLVAKGDPEQNR